MLILRLIKTIKHCCICLVFPGNGMGDLRHLLLLIFLLKAGGSHGRVGWEAGSPAQQQ